ncbi:unnamed protein product [Pylaiella littoralis]
MIMGTQRRLLLAAVAALAALAPSCAFVTAAPKIPAQQQQQHSLFSTSRAVAGGGNAPAVAVSAGGQLFMMAGDDTATEQKGLVTVYHKETCPYCKKALTLLEEDYSLSVTRVDVLEGEDSEKKIRQMKTFSGANTVPQVFFNSEHLGGNDDVQKLHADGKLEALVAKVRAEAPGMMKPTWYHPWY